MKLYPISMPDAMAKRAKSRAKKLHGPRGFSRYVRGLIQQDFAKGRK